MEILEQAVDYGFVDFTTVFGDSTHQKANANKRKSVKKEVEILKKKYEDDLLVEINEDRECIGKESFDSMVHTEYVHDEETGEEVKKTSTKTITESTIDPESGCFHKGEKEKCFAYSHQTFCDKNSFVLAVTTEGNTEIEKAADYVIYIPKTNAYFANSLAIIPLQLFGYYVAVGKGCDVDKPRNLAKSVTVE